MATQRKKPGAAAARNAAKKPVKKITVKPTQSKAVPGSKGSFTAQMRSRAPKEEKVVSNVDPDSFIEVTKAIRAKYGTHVFVLDVPWEERQLATTLGAEWVEKIRKHVYAGTLLPAPLQKYKSVDYSLERWLEDNINRAYAPNEAPTGPLFQPRPHQQEGIDDIESAGKAGWRAFVVADSTGVGKSLTGLLGASRVAALRGFTAQKKAKLLIIGPKAVLPHWRNTIKQSGVDNLRILVINYDQYKRLLTVPKTAADAKKTRTKNKRIASQGKSFIKWDLIISDESHKLKTIDAQRTQAFETIAGYEQPAKTAPFVIFMSATIGQEPMELGYLAPLVGQASRNPGLKLKTWGQWLADNDFHVKEGKVGWNWVKPLPNATPEQKAQVRAQQIEDVKKLSAMLFGNGAPSIRRKPEDIAGWPSIQTIPLPVDLSADDYASYNKAWTEFRKEMQMHARGKNPQGSLAIITRFRQKISLISAPQTVEQILELLDNGIQVAVSVEFMETIEHIRVMLKKHGIEVAEISGRQGLNREYERLRFQKGEVKVVLFSVTEAISLHAKETLPDGTKATPHRRATIVHDIRWSALQTTQIIGRTHRDGELAIAYFVIANRTVNVRILESMLRKMENMNALSGEDPDDEALQLAWSLLD